MAVMTSRFWFGIMTREFYLGTYIRVLISHRNARGKVWGSDDVNVEGWKALKRLPGHDSGTLVASKSTPA